MKIPKFWVKKKPKQEKHMQHFSEEYRQKLIAEHKLIAATIAQLTAAFPRYVQNNSVDGVNAAISNLRIEKIQLEGKIDTLNEYLNG